MLVTGKRENNTSDAVVNALIKVKSEMTLFGPGHQAPSRNLAATVHSLYENGTKEHLTVSCVGAELCSLALISHLISCRHLVTDECDIMSLAP